MKNITNDIVTEFINSYYKPLNNEFEIFRRNSEEKHVPIILKETEILLHTLLGLKKPKKILEIGTAVGYSSCFFATICPDVEIVTVEKNETMYEEAKANIKKYGYEDRIKVYQGDGEEVVLALDESIKDFDLVFIDAAKSHYDRFLNASLKRCKNEALIICDNILFHGKTVSDQYDLLGKHRTNIRHLREFVEDINNREDLSTSILSCGDGLSLSIYRGENE